MPENMDIKFRLYPRSWEGQNRLFIQAFRDGKAGKLFLSPYYYGDEREVRFITDTVQQSHDCHLQHSLNTTMLWGEENSTNCLLPLHNKVANPLHETSFELLMQVINQSQWYHWDEQPDFLSAFADAAPMAETLDTRRPGQNLELYFDSLESKTLTVITAGEQSLLFLDWGGRGTPQPVFSLATGFALDNIAYGQLLELETRRPGSLHDAWKLTFDILHMAAAQYLISHYAVPLFEAWLEKVHTALNKKFTAGGTPRAANGNEQGSRESSPDETSSSDDSSSDDSSSDDSTSPMESGQSNRKKPDASKLKPGSGDSSDSEGDDPHPDPSGSESSRESSDDEDGHVVKKKKESDRNSIATLCDNYVDSDNEELNNMQGDTTEGKSLSKQVKNVLSFLNEDLGGEDDPESFGGKGEPDTDMGTGALTKVTTSGQQDKEKNATALYSSGLHENLRI